MKRERDEERDKKFESFLEIKKLKVGFSSTNFLTFSLYYLFILYIARAWVNKGLIGRSLTSTQPDQQPKWGLKPRR